MTRIHRDVHWTGTDDYRVRLVGDTTAPPEAVYDLLADLRRHLEWAGTEQSRIFRLLDLDADVGAVAPGLQFRSTGTVPMLRAQWANHNVVDEARPPHCFAFTTQGRIDWSRAPWWNLPPREGDGQGTFHHRYEIEPHDGGSRVTYTMQQDHFDNAPWGVRWPGVRIAMHRVIGPHWLGRGFANLLRLAAATPASVEQSSD